MSYGKLDSLCRTCVRISQGYCDGAEKDELNRPCDFYKRMTNADRIRAMTDEEMAKLLCDFIGCVDCPYLRRPECGEERIGWLDWLRRDVTDNG